MTYSDDYSFLESLVDAFPMAFVIALFICFPITRVPIIITHVTIWMSKLFWKYPWLSIVIPMGLAIIYNQKMIMDKQTAIYMRQNLFNGNAMCPL